MYENADPHGILHYVNADFALICVFYGKICMASQYFQKDLQSCLFLRYGVNAQIYNSMRDYYDNTQPNGDLYATVYNKLEL